MASLFWCPRDFYATLLVLITSVESHGAGINRRHIAEERVAAKSSRPDRQVTRGPLARLASASDALTPMER